MSRNKRSALKAHVKRIQEAARIDRHEKRFAPEAKMARAKARTLRAVIRGALRKTVGELNPTPELQKRRQKVIDQILAAAK